MTHSDALTRDCDHRSHPSRTAARASIAGANRTAHREAALTRRPRRGRARAAATIATLLIGLLAPAPALAAGADAPAKGAPLGQVVIGTAGAALVTALVLWIAKAHRDGRISWLARLAGSAERVSGIPGWAALPAALTGVSLAVAVFGFYWDVAKHIDTGRDPSPFGTAAHYPILVGLFGIALGGFLAIVLGAPKDVPTSVRITRDWHAPLGGVLIFLCGGFALSGFPLDDVWHTLFGQDVTLWGPTHVLMVGGASLATLGAWVLLVEGLRARERPRGQEPLWLRLRAASMAGAFLLGLSTLQGEFDFGVPQFQLVYQPILIALAASVGLVAARVRLGRGGALQAVAFFLVVRVLLAVVIGPVLGQSTPHFPLYVAEALLVELVGLRIGSDRPLSLGVAAGALIGTVGLAAEWGWSHLWMPLPWPGSVLPEAAALGITAALAGGVLGGLIGRALTSHAERQHAPGWLLRLAGLVAVACIAFPLPMNAGRSTTASVTLADVKPGPNRTVSAVIHVSPAGAAQHAQWLTVTAWQGGSLVVDRLQRIGETSYRTTRPVPVYGQWKSMLRLENGRGVRAVPLYMPADRAIPAPEVPAPAHFTRPFVRDKKILQREAVGGSMWLTTPAYLLLLAIATGWLIALARGLARLESSAGAPKVTDRAPGVTRPGGAVTARAAR